MLGCDYSTAPLAPRSTDPETAYPHPSAFRGWHSAFAMLGCVSLIFQPIPKPAVNDLPLLVANRAEIEKVGPFSL